jgi:hypothetical protein
MVGDSVTEGSDDKELVVSQRGTFDAETGAKGSRTNRMRPPWRARTEARPPCRPRRRVLGRVRNYEQRHGS